MKNETDLKMSARRIRAVHVYILWGKNWTALQCGEGKTGGGFQK